MADKAFRVLLDLTDIHIESLKYVWMNVSPQELKTIADFKTSIRNKVNLEKVDIKLFVRSGLLLDNETVMILREDDTVKVQYESQYNPGYNDTANSVQENRMSSRKRNHSESHSDLFINSKRCKSGSKSLTPENEICFNEMKRKKHKQSHSMCSGQLFNQLKTFEADKHSTVKIHKKKDEEQITPFEKNAKDTSLLHFDPFFLFDNREDTIEENENNISKTDISVSPSCYLKLNSTEDSLRRNDFNLEQKGLKKPSEINTKSLNKSEGLGNNCPKKKRKRRKKRKEVLGNVINADNIDVNNEFKSFIHDVNEKVEREHTVYSSSPCKEPKLTDCDNIVNVKNSHLDTFIMDTSIPNVNIEPSHNYPKISTPAQSNYCGNPIWGFSAMQTSNFNSNSNETVGFKKGKNKNVHIEDGNGLSVSSENFKNSEETSELHYTDLPPLVSKPDIGTHIAYKNETASFKKGKNKNNVHIEAGNELSVSSENFKNSEKTSELHYTDLPPLASRPDIGTRIAYKILELDEHYNPVISDYREGIIKSIKLENEEMEIELLKHEIKPGRIGKFENLKGDERPPPEVKRCDTVKWSNLIDPKLVIR